MHVVKPPCLQYNRYIRLGVIEVEKALAMYKKRGRLFLKDTKLVYPLLLEIMDADAARKIIDMSISEYGALAPDIPFIGGRANPMSKDLEEAAKLLAFYKAMESAGHPPETAFKIIFCTFEYKMEKYPKFLLKLMGTLQLSSFFKRKLVRLSEISQAKKYPEGFVFKIVNGEGGSFDWGIEFSECAILKFYKAQAAERFMPFICPNDFITSRYFGLGLNRTMTLAEGRPICDQYLKRGRETAIKFPPGISL